jgi:hypothetical protein
MIDVVLLAGRLLLLALLYLFLFAAVKAGIGLVAGQRKRGAGAWMVKVVQGPSALMGITVPIVGPVVIGRSPGADIVIGDDFVSAKHTRISPTGDGAVIEDLGSTNSSAPETRSTSAASSSRWTARDSALKAELGGAL